jgi:hypothetical protein
MATHRVKAFNSATASENKIHDTAVARTYGFEGGLVPGVTVFAYMTQPVVATWGREWFEGGAMSARFAKPFYEGELVVANAEGDGHSLELSAAGEDGEARATGSAGLDTTSAPDPADYPTASLPAERPPAIADNLQPGTVLGSVEAGFRAAKAGVFLDELSDDLPIYRGDDAIAHPGWLILTANLILSSNVKLGPWIHVSSDITNFAPVSDGQRVTTRGRVADRFDRKGHEFVELDLLWTIDDRPVMHARHTAIYKVRKLADK